MALHACSRYSPLQASYPLGRRPRRHHAHQCRTLRADTGHRALRDPVRGVCGSVQVGARFAGEEYVTTYVGQPLYAVCTVHSATSGANMAWGGLASSTYAVSAPQNVEVPQSVPHTLRKRVGAASHFTPFNLVVLPSAHVSACDPGCTPCPPVSLTRAGQWVT